MNDLFLSLVDLYFLVVVFSLSALVLAFPLEY